MANKKFTNDDLGGEQLDMLSMFGLGGGSDSDSAGEAAVEDDSDDAAEVDDGAEEKKPAAKKSAPKKGKASLTGPVSVIGCGWSETVGEDGKKYTPAGIAKLVFDRGYKEVAAAELSYSDKSNTVYVQSVGTSASDYELGAGKLVQQVETFETSDERAPDLLAEGIRERARKAYIPDEFVRIHGCVAVASACAQETADALGADVEV